jgi:hypothetical protein
VALLVADPVPEVLRVEVQREVVLVAVALVQVGPAEVAMAGVEAENS